MAFTAKEVGLNPRHAVFTPSLSPMYVKCQGTHRGRIPPQITLDDFDFYNPNKLGFTWQAALYSAGHASDLKLENPDPERMVTKRDRDKTIMVCDSGGYQIGNGVLKIDQDLRSASADELRMKILRWLEFNSDYSMIFDWPAWAVGTPKFRLKTFRDCLNETKYNNDFFVKHRKAENMKFLNVVQGRTWGWDNEDDPVFNQAHGEIYTWYNEVKHYPFNGWAVAGPVSADMYYFLCFLLTAWNDGLINKDKNWIHVLGKARPDAAFTMTVINDCLQRYVDPSLQISYDASSAFLYSVNGQILAGHNPLELSIITDTIPNLKKYVGSTEKIPLKGLQSPLTDLLTAGDFCIDLTKNSLIETSVDYGNGLVGIKDTKKNGEYGNYMDTMSYLISMYHNVWIQIRCVDEFSNLALLSIPELKEMEDYYITERKNAWSTRTGNDLRRKMIEKDHIEEIFKSGDPKQALKELEKRKKYLHDATKTERVCWLNVTQDLQDNGVLEIVRDTIKPAKPLTKQEKNKLKPPSIKMDIFEENT